MGFPPDAPCRDRRIARSRDCNDPRKVLSIVGRGGTGFRPRQRWHGSDRSVERRIEMRMDSLRPRLVVAAVVVAALTFAAPALAAPKPPSCKDAATSALAGNGYNPATLGTVSGRSSSAVNGEIQSLCAGGTPVPQVDAQVLKDSTITAPAIGTFLSGVFGFNGPQAAGVLKAVGFGATEIATALLGSFGQTAEQGAELLQSLGFGADDIAGALKVVYSLTGAATAGSCRASASA